MNEARHIATHPVARALEYLGDRWAILILREAFTGTKQFNQFLANTGASKGSLAKSLKYLTDTGLLTKQPQKHASHRFEYRLTNKGLDLFSWALTLWDWEKHWAPKNGALPTELYHDAPLSQPHPLVPQVICQHCRVEIVFEDIERIALSNIELTTTQPEKLTSQRRKRLHHDAPQQLAHITEIIGDRWSLLIIGSIFIGSRKFDKIQKELGIASNILSNRLKLLQDNDIIAKATNSTRAEYKLTDKGRSLYPLTMVLREWSLKWLSDTPHPFTLVHTPCKEKLHVEVICGGCQEKPAASDVNNLSPQH